MRELVYKNIYGENPRKCEVSIEETCDPIEALRSKKWLCKYYIKARFAGKDQKAVNEWIRMQKKAGCSRNCHILRKLDHVTGENTLICKVLGEFFVVRGLTAYKILYVNQIRIRSLAAGARA